MTRPPRALALVSALALATALASGRLLAQSAPYVPTPDALVDTMLELAKTGPGDYVIDLGSGDGRIPIRAVSHYAARNAVGIDIDGELVRKAREHAHAAGVDDRVRFVEGDLFAADVREATVVTVYLIPSMMAAVERKLRAELKPGARIVVHDYPFPSWTAERYVEVESVEKIRATGQTDARFFLYRVPETKAQPPRQGVKGPSP
jgi:cyclopropane fatty-acyl-phospholipid synthase-like methyltransferase